MKWGIIQCMISKNLQIAGRAKCSIQVVAWGCFSDPDCLSGDTHGWARKQNSFCWAILKSNHPSGWIFLFPFKKRAIGLYSCCNCQFTSNYQIATISRGGSLSTTTTMVGFTRSRVLRLGISCTECLSSNAP